MLVLVDRDARDARASVSAGVAGARGGDVEVAAPRAADLIFPADHGPIEFVLSGGTHR
jgi:hypothetical protein